MKLKVKIKSISEVQTGGDWRGRYLLLNWKERREDGNVSRNFVKAMAFGPELEKVERDFQPGDSALVDVTFSSTDLQSGFFSNKARIMSIEKISDSEVGEEVAV